MSGPKPLIIVAGLGTGSGTGSASARLFSKNGYTVALVSRARGDSLTQLAQELTASGGEAAAFPLSSYSEADVKSVFNDIRARFPASTYSIRVAIFNAAHGVWKPFLDVTPQDVQESLQVNVEAAFAFSRQSILEFKSNDIDAQGKRGTLIFTGATASIRGNVTTSAFAAGKAAQRSLSQSLAKEFGKENIHVAHAIIDGVILTGRTKERISKIGEDSQWETNANVRLDPNSIASSYLYLVNQDRSSWTWELDLRPAHERW